MTIQIDQIGPRNSTVEYLSDCCLVVAGTQAPSFSAKSELIIQTASGPLNILDTQRVTSTARLFPAAEMREYKKIANAWLNNVVRWYTSPWCDSGHGGRILHSANLEKFQTESMQYFREFEAAVDAFIARVPALLDVARSELGDVYDEIEEKASGLNSGDSGNWQKYICTGDLISGLRHASGLFSLGYTLAPIPTSDVKMRGLEFNQQHIWRQRIDAAKQKSAQEATGAAWSRLALYMSRIAGALNDPKRPLYESTVENLQEFAKSIEGFNLAGDPALAQISSDIISKLDAVKVETLRKDKDERAKAAHEIERAMAGLCQSKDGEAALRDLATTKRKDQQNEAATARAELDKLSSRF